jgi:calcineurin-like phosphoesterase family protein
MDHKTKDILNLITPEARKVMETIWFTADLHHGHPKIVNICNRPVYIDSKIKDEFLHKHANDEKPYDIYRDKEFLRNYVDPALTEWLVKDVINKWVKKKDTLILGGDVTFAKRADAERFLDRLNGNKFLIVGNHDKNIQNSTRFSQITQIKDYTFSQFGLNIHIALCHYPLVSWNRKPHGSWHLYGHVHGRYKHPDLAFDIGIDNTDLISLPNGGWRPINLYEVCQIMSEKAKLIGEYEATKDFGLDIED